MSKVEEAAVNDRSLAKGLIAGLVGGLAGTLAQTCAQRFTQSLAERLLPPRADAEPEPQEPAAEPTAAHPRAPSAKSVAGEVVHWGLGAAIGAAYGALAEFYPDATAKRGASFGLALQALTQEDALPALGLMANAAGQASAVPSYVAYGVTTEIVRGFVRKRL
jgi:putative membrane protein